MKKKLEKFSKKYLKYKFKNFELLNQALTHSSKNKINNEKLEFLGDSLLNFIITEKLYNKFPEKHEGELTRIRANLVNKKKLTIISKKLKISKYILYGNSIKDNDKKISILANAIEAIFGSIYLDGGLSKIKKIINKIYKKDLKSNKLLKKDAKTFLQELLQSKKINTPKYKIIKIFKNNNKDIFKIKCKIKKLNIFSTGTAYSKKKAEQKSAKKIIKTIIKNKIIEKLNI